MARSGTRSRSNPNPSRSGGRVRIDIAAERHQSDVLIDLALEEDLGTWFVRMGMSRRIGPAIRRLGDMLSHSYVHVKSPSCRRFLGRFPWAIVGRRLTKTLQLKRFARYACSELSNPSSYACSYESSR